MTAPTVERTDSPDLSDAYPTIAWRARDWAEREPQRVVMRDKDFGVWHERTWADLWDQIVTVAHGLLALGVPPVVRHARKRGLDLEIAETAAKASM